MIVLEMDKQKWVDYAERDFGICKFFFALFGSYKSKTAFFQLE